MNVTSGGVTLSEQLAWFQARVGQTVPWPDEAREGMLLATKAKGIYKPAGTDLALSIRIAKNGPYPNSPELRADGSWAVRYHAERQTGNTKPVANQGLRNCMERQQPVGVMLQVQRSPHALYDILGLGQVTAYAHGLFVIEGPWDAISVTPAISEAARVQQEHDELTDARDRMLAEVVRRQGQGKFRQDLLKAYAGTCAVSGCTVEHVLEAAHIVPYRGPHSNVTRNGVLLRADLHTLFDLGHLSLCPDTLKVQISQEIWAEYGLHNGQPLLLPTSLDDQPDPRLVRLRHTMLKNKS